MTKEQIINSEDLVFTKGEVLSFMDDWANQVSAAKDKEIAEIKAFSKQAIELITDNHKLEIEKRDKEIADLKDTVERMAARLQELAQDTIKAQGHN